VTDHREHDPIQGTIVHQYDDIKEADNKLPQWWLWSFYLAIAFAFGYWIWFEAFAVGDSPLDRYSQERMAALDTGEPVTDELLLGLAADRLTVRAGQKTFGQNCAKCHGSSAEGNIGPNLTDSFWIGGHAPVDIYQTIIDGRSGKGMPAWGLQLGPGASKQVAAYVITLRDTNVPGKAPQGERVAPEPAAAVKTANK
jgi:cytochrome c oxidase cbb3-type subunit 3